MMTRFWHPVADMHAVREGIVGRGLAQMVDDPGLTDRVTLEARDHGVLTRSLVGGDLQVSPPLVITRDELDEVASGLAGALDDVAAAR